MAQATSVAEIFQAMPGRFNAQAAQGVNATYQFDLTGDNGGTYHVKIANGACQVEQGPAASPNITITMAARTIST